MDQWIGIKHFRRDSHIDNWGNPDWIKRDLLLKLDALREDLGNPIYVTSGSGGKHSDGSYHYLGMAADTVIAIRPNIIFPLDVVFKAIKHGFTGIGVYPHWKLKGVQTCGYHFDIRPAPHAFWLAVLDYKHDKQKYEQEYIALNYLNLKKYLPGF